VPAEKIKLGCPAAPGIRDYFSVLEASARSDPHGLLQLHGRSGLVPHRVDQPLRGGALAAISIMP